MGRTTTLAPAESEPETVRLDTVPWPVGEFEGTPLYAEVDVTAPAALYIPVGGDYWQRLERTAGAS